MVIPILHEPCRHPESKPANPISRHHPLYDQLRDLHSIEIQLGESFPELAAMAGDREIRELISMQAFRSARRAARLAEVLSRHGVEIGTDACEAMQGLIVSGHRHLRSVTNSSTRDLMILSHCQRIQQYGLAGYDAASQLASALDLEVEERLLESPVVEYRTALRRLESIGERLFGSKPVKKSFFPAIFGSPSGELAPAIASAV